jgi:N6-adenosine-specific RNA methylase IME4
MSLPFPEGPFDIVYADPPWPMWGDPYKNAAAAKHYNLMSMQELCALPVRKIMSKRSVLFLWVTCPRMDLGVDLIRSWGLYYRGIPYIWIKTRKDGKIINGQGVPPTFTKPTSELVLAATTNKSGRPFPILSMNQPQVILASRTRIHSQKPQEVRKAIEELCGNRPRIELFAREHYPNWISWGKENEL